MKTYDLYGAMPGNPAPKADRGATSATDVALRVQAALGIDVYARDGRSFDDYRCNDFGTEKFGEVFVSANLSRPGGAALFPDLDYAVVVGVNEPVDVSKTQAALEAIEFPLVRRRRREYALPESDSTSTTVDLYGAPSDAAAVVAALSPALGVSFDGNEHAATGGDSHYYDESTGFGTLLVFDNVATPFDDPPFPEYSESATVVITINSPDRSALSRILTSHGFTLLKSTGVEARQ